MSAGPEGRLVERLFRHEAGRLTATLVRLVGPDQLALAEDLVQETLLVALEHWRFGVPDNPAAWLTRVAQHRALDALRRRSTVLRAAPEVAEAWQAQALAQQVEAHFRGEVGDDVLRLMFSCCAPRLTVPAQLVVILKTLCGFSVGEIAGALLVAPDAVERRLSRAKAALREHGLYEPQRASDLEPRLEAVQHALYLLFNEGYHGAHPQAAVRDDLCSEALRLGEVLCANPLTATPTTHALMALLSLQAARVNARRDDVGALLALRDQDRSKWSPALIRLGFEHFERSAAGDTLSTYHLQAALAAVHASAPSWEATDWPRLVELYDALVAVEDTPIVRLNRAIALGQRDGAPAGLMALDAIDPDALRTYPFLFAARGEFLAATGQLAPARAAFDEALACARNPAEAAFLARRRALVA